MKVKIRYYAMFRDVTGKTEETMELPDGLTVQEVREHVKGIFPRIASREMVLVAVNGAFTTLDHVVEDGDLLAFFPPVSGG